MQRETAFAGGVVAVVVVMLLSAALVPGVIPERDSEPDVRASHLDIREDDSTIRKAAVPGDTVVFGLDIRLRHRGGPAENVTVEVRAFDDDTNLLATSERVDAGTVEGDREVSVPVNLTVDREGGYRFETIVYENGTRVAHASQSISGVGALTPDYSRSPIGFQRFDSEDGTTIAPRETQVEDGRVTLNASTFLTNSGSETAGDVTLLVRARQADSNLIANEARQTVGSIRPGRSVQTDVELTVPDGYNYWLDAILFEDGVIIDTARGPAALDPPMNASEATADGDEFEASDFEGDRVTDEPEPTEAGAGSADGATPTFSGEGPGFGLAAALVGLLVAALLIARNHD